MRRADLQAVNAYLLSVRGREPVPAPTRERSLQIFGDEKRLDDLRKGDLALFEGRVTLADLHCYTVAPPLPHETPPKREPGRPIPGAGELSLLGQLPPVGTGRLRCMLPSPTAAATPSGRAPATSTT